METIVIIEKERNVVKAILGYALKMNFVFIYHVYIFTYWINYKNEILRTYAKALMLCTAGSSKHWNSAWHFNWFCPLSSSYFHYCYYYCEDTLWTLKICQNNIGTTTYNQTFTIGHIPFQIRHLSVASKEWLPVA